MGCDLHKKDAFKMKINNCEHKKFIGNEEVYDAKTEEAAKHLKFALKYYIATVMNQDMYTYYDWEDIDGREHCEVSDNAEDLINELMEKIEVRVTDERDLTFDTCMLYDEINKAALDMEPYDREVE